MIQKKPLIKVEKLVKNYGKNSVLKGLDFSIFEGERVAIVAPNGAGKTTFIEILCQFRKFNSGKIYYLNGKKDFLRNLGVHFQDSSYPSGITVNDLIYFYTNIYKTKLDKKLYQKFGIEKLANIDFSDLSFGQKKRVDVFLLLLSKVKFIILDEITAGMDIYVKYNIINSIVNYIKENNVTLIYISHNLDEIKKICNRLVMLKNGVFEVDKTNLANVNITKLMENLYSWKI